MTPIRDHLESVVLAGVLLLIGVVLAPDYGVSDDEYIHYEYAYQVSEVYAGLREPTDVLLNLEYYGPAFNLVSRGLSSFLQTTGIYSDAFTGWHISYFVTFVLAAWSIYAICRRFVSKAASLSAMLLFATQPLLFGHAFINPKDIPLMGLFSVSILLGFWASDWPFVWRMTKGTLVEANFESIRKTVLLSRWRLASIAQRAGFLAGAFSLVVVAGGSITGIWTRVSESLLRHLYSDAVSPVFWKLFEIVAEDAWKTPVDAYIRKVHVSLPWVSLTVVLIILLWTLVLGIRIFSGETAVAHLRGARPWLFLLLASVGLGITSSVRTSGIFVGILVSLLWLRNSKLESIPSLVIYWSSGLGVMYLTWPFLWGAPIRRLLATVRYMMDFPYQQTELFEGLMYHAYELPRYYLPKILTLQFTEALYVATTLGVMYIAFRALRSNPVGRPFELLLVCCWFLLPVGAAYLLKTPLYNNFRQLLFVTPPLFIVAGLGIDAAFSLARNPFARTGLVALIILPGVLGILTLHPYEYIYYNSFVGGVAGAAGRYPTDYWCTSSKESVEFINRVAAPGETIGYTRQYHMVRPYAREDFELVSVLTASEAIDSGARYVFTCRETRFPEFPAAFRVERGGATLSIVRLVVGGK